MKTRIGINGFGRIGRLTLRALLKNHQDELEVVAVNDLADTRTNAHLLKWDSTYGGYPGTVEASDTAITVDGKEILNALHVPRQAVFDKNGKTHVFVKVGDRFEQRAVTVAQRTESRVALEGLSEGTEVALIDPTAASRPSSAPSSSPLSSGSVK